MPDPQHGIVGDGDRDVVLTAGAHEVEPTHDALVARGEALFLEVHNKVVDDTTEDESMASGASNRTKKLYVCKHTKKSPDAFDLTDRFPLVAWAISGDPVKAQCGLYVSLLRKQLFSELAKQMTVRVDEIEQNHAESEFWAQRFDDLMYTHNTGMFKPKRLLH